MMHRLSARRLGVWKCSLSFCPKKEVVKKIAKKSCASLLFGERPCLLGTMQLIYASLKGEVETQGCCREASAMGTPKAPPCPSKVLGKDCSDRQGKRDTREPESQGYGDGNEPWEMQRMNWVPAGVPRGG
jgi:hypothetical protein